MIKDVLVTVVCKAYNHGKYIRDALEGFVSQKTSFGFKVVVHDDASTDNTAEIIAEYAKNYPDLIFPIYQSENQYSKGIVIFDHYIRPHLEGDYVAWCEGDDFWTSENKLEKMVSYLIAHDDCACCCHAYNRIHANDKTLISVNRCRNSDGVLDAKDLIMYKNPPQLCAQVFKRELYDISPKYRTDTSAGDYPRLLQTLEFGYTYYFDEVMSSYRVSADGSWTERIYKNVDKQNQHWECVLKCLDIFDEQTEFKYSSIISAKKDEIQFKVLLNQKKYRDAKKHPCYKAATINKKIEITVGSVLPGFAYCLKKIHRKIKSR